MPGNKSDNEAGRGRADQRYVQHVDGKLLVEWRGGLVQRTGEPHPTYAAAHEGQREEPVGRAPGRPQADERGRHRDAERRRRDATLAVDPPRVRVDPWNEGR